MTRFIRKFVINETERSVKIFLAIAVMDIFLYKVLNRFLINSPDIIWYVFGALSIWYTIFYLKEMSSKLNLGLLATYAKGLLVLGLFYYFICYSTFCLFSKVISNKSDKEIFSCELIGASSSMRNHSVYYKFLGDRYRFSMYGKEIVSLSTQDDLSGKYVQLEAKRGLLGSYIICDMVLL